MTTENELSSTISNVLHDKALRKAFYNVAAILFTIFVSGIAVAVYYILQPFLRPMLWALLCGSFLYPFKYKIAYSSKVWLCKLNSSKTPLFLGLITLPFVLVSCLIDAFRTTLYKHYKFIIGGIVFFVLIILFASMWPFKELMDLGEKLFSAIKLILDCFSGYMISTLILGYIIIVALFCNAKTKLFLQLVSMVLWTIVIFYMASVKGPLAIFLGVVVTALVTGGSLVDTIRLRIQNIGIEGEVARRTSSSSAVRISTSSPHKVTSDAPSSHMLLSMTSNEEVTTKSFSDNCLVTLMWCIILLQLWIYGVLLTIGILLVTCLAIQSLGHKFGVWSFLQGWFYSKAFQVKEKISSDERFYVVVPKPIRMFFKIIIEGDAKALRFLESSTDKICSALIIFLLLITVGLFAVFTALEVHKESMHLVHVTSNALNTTRHPDLANWLPESDVLQNALDSMVKNAYIYGRESIGRQLSAFLHGDEDSKQHLEKQILKLWDTLYNTWLNSNKSLEAHEKSISFKELGLSSGIPDFIQKMRHTNLNFVSIAKENVDLFMSVIKSVWSVLVSNLALTVKIMTSMISVIFGGSTAIFNTLLSVVIFLTTLFYLLSTSEDQYMPVKLFSSMSPGYFDNVQSFKFGKAFQDAIGSVFLVSCKMAMFYGLYTWFTHSLLGIQIVFIPSVLAAVFAAVPFLGTYVAALPAVLELWLINGQPYSALLLFAAHYLPTFVIDTAFYSEMRGGHPYLTGLAILGGMYWMGLEGAIIGPVLLCCFVVAMHMYQSMLQPEVFND